MRTGPALMVMSLMAIPACGADTGANGAGDPGQAAAADAAQRGTRTLTAIDACSLLTADEVRTILGQSASGQPDPDAGFDLSCNWDAESPDGMRQAVSVEVGRLQPESALRQEFNTFKKNMTFQANVSGIGDEAFLAQYGLSGSSLVIRADDLLVFINTTEKGQGEMLKKLGPGVLDRLR